MDVPRLCRNASFEVVPRLAQLHQRVQRAVDRDIHAKSLPAARDVTVQRIDSRVCALDAYSINGQAFDVGMMAAFGILGYVFKKLEIPLAPLILTLILGPLMEQSLRQSLEMSRGKFSIFVEHPISLGLIIVAVLFASVSMLPGCRRCGARIPRCDVSGAHPVECRAAW